MSQAIVAAVRAKYPTPLAEKHPLFLLEVAGALGKGLVKKPNGTNITLPDGTKVSQDCVMEHDGQLWDILQDGEASANPVYNQGDPIDSSRYYAVAGAIDPPKPQTPTTDPLLGSRLDRAEANIDNAHMRIAKLEAAQESYEGHLIPALNQVIADLTQRVKAMEDTPDSLELPPLEAVGRIPIFGEIKLPVREKK